MDHLQARIIRWAGKKTLLVCCEERAARSRLSSNQTFGDLGSARKGEAEVAGPYQSFGQRQSLGHCGEQQTTDESSLFTKNLKGFSRVISLK